MKVKTQDLTGTALDWAVAKCEAWSAGSFLDGVVAHPNYNNFHPSTNWAQGGPIIEQEGITVCHGSPVHGLEWMACDRSSTHIQHGPSYLIAAMRCFCASKLGEEIEIPKELK